MLTESCRTEFTTSFYSLLFQKGQYMTVVREEMPAIEASFRHFDTQDRQYRPKLSIIICGKRHHTRFYPAEAENADRNGNPRPGTVVDRGITAVYEFDFFLQGRGHSSSRLPPNILRLNLESSRKPSRHNSSHPLLRCA